MAGWFGTKRRKRNWRPAKVSWTPLGQTSGRKEKKYGTEINAFTDVDPFVDADARAGIKEKQPGSQKAFPAATFVQCIHSAAGP